MPAKIIDGKKISQKLLENIKKRVKGLKEKPGLALVLVGNNPASEIYVNFKEKTCKEIGFYCERYNLDKNASIEIEAETISPVISVSVSPDLQNILVLGNYNPVTRQSELYLSGFEEFKPKSILSTQAEKIEALSSQRFILFESLSIPKTNTSIFCPCLYVAGIELSFSQATSEMCTKPSRCP